MASDSKERDGQAPFAFSGMGWADPGEDHPFERREAERYLLGRSLGRGGMGEVCEAIDQRLDRRVALKVLRAHEPEIERRLAREASLTAMLDHPGIVPVHDAGRRADGRLFYTMRLVEGRSLAEVIRDTPDPAARRRLLRPLLMAVEAMGHAHARGVIHRDLKPGNLMLGTRGEAVVVDWGLAKRVAGEDDSADGLDAQTAQGTVLGTPAFMSPEQARGEPVGPASDVWSLGAVLYAVLVGEAPFLGDSSGEILRQVQAGRAPSLPDSIPAELRAVLARAMAERPAKRYPDAGALADDLEHYLDGRLVAAHDYTAADRAGRALWRWRVPLVAAVVVLAAVAISAALAWREADKARQVAEAARDEQRALAHVADVNLQRAVVSKALNALEADARAEAELLAAYALTLQGEPAQEALARGVLAAWSGRPRPRVLSQAPLPADCGSPQLSPDGTRLLCQEARALSLWDVGDMGLAWRREGRARWAGFAGNGDVVLHLHDTHRGVVLDGATGGVLEESGAFTWQRFADSRDPAQTGTFASSGATRLWRRGEPSYRSMDLCPGGTDDLTGLAVSSAGAWLVACRAQVEVMRPGEGLRPLRHLQLTPRVDEVNAIWSSTFAPSGAVAALGSLEGWVELVDTAADRSLGLRRLGRGMVLALDLTEDGERVVVSVERGGTMVWDVSAEVVQRIPGWAADVALTDAGFVQVGEDRVTTWAVPAASLPSRLAAPAGVTSAALSPDGRSLAATTGFWLTAWDAETGAPVMLETPGDAVVKDGAFSTDGSRFYAVGAGITSVAVLDTSSWTRLPDLEGRQSGRRVGALAGGVVWALPWGLGPLVWVDGQLQEGLRTLGAEFSEGESNHAGTFALFREDQRGGLYRLSVGPPVTLEEVWRPEIQPRALDISADGQTLVYADDDHLRVVDLRRKAVVRRVPVDAMPLDLALSPDDRRVALSDLRGRVRVISLETGETEAILRGHGERAYSVEFSSDGRQVLSGGWDNAVRVWGLEALEVDPEALLEQLTVAWRMSAEDALAAEL
ncbi:MAG: protein kinase [Alphaproteobacteria bacterium]|nr:protein kinase [Alphaproteobacteria bacterium]